MINVIITMAGHGLRFKKAGYDLPKYKIKVKGRTLFEWSMSSFKATITGQIHYVFIVRQADSADLFIRTQCEKLGIKNFDIVELSHSTDGQATSVLYAKPFVQNNNPIYIFNIDTYIEPPHLAIPNEVMDGFIPCFISTGDHWSFVQVDQAGRALRVVEKNRISENCSVGAYYFKTWEQYENAYNKHYLCHKSESGEKYIAPIYNELIQQGAIVKISLIPNNKVHVLGTPEELRNFEKEV